MMTSTSSFLSVFLHSLELHGPLSSALVVQHHFQDAGPTLRTALAEDVDRILWEAFGRGLVAVYQAEYGASDFFILTSAGRAALREAAAEEDVEDHESAAQDQAEGAPDAEAEPAPSPV